MPIEVIAAVWECHWHSLPRELTPISDDPKGRAYRRGLAPVLPTLITQLTPPFEHDVDKFKRTKLELEQLPYSLGGMSYAFFAFVRHQAQLKSLARQDGMLWLKPEETEPLCYMLDLFLDHARRAANAIVPYLRHKYSLHGQVHWSIARWNEGDWEKVPDCDVRELARKYWEGYGKKVKDYRDLSQHRTLVAYDDCGLVTRAGVTEFYIALPNNPDVFRDGKPKAMERLSYDPPIHATPYMQEVLHETIRFVNRFSVRLLDPSKPRNVALLGPNIRGSIGPSRQGIRVLSVRTIDAELRKLLAELAEEESRGA